MSDTIELFETDGEWHWRKVNGEGFASAREAYTAAIQANGNVTVWKENELGWAPIDP